LLYSFLAYLLVTSNSSNQKEVSESNAIYTEAAAAVFAGMTKTAANTDSSLVIESTVTPNQSSDDISIDKNLLDIEITFPASLYSDTDMSTFNTEAYVQENRFKKVVVNDDGSLTITMSRSRQKELMEEFVTEIEESFAEMIEAENTPYISNITNEADFRKVIVDVDRVGYESAFDLTPISIWFEVYFYQSLAGIDYHCEVIVRDMDTKEIIKSLVFPDDL
jgi:hypothetical protein